MKKKVRQLLVTADFGIFDFPEPKNIRLLKPMLDIRVIHVNLSISFAGCLELHYDLIWKLAESFRSCCTMNISIDVPLYIKYDNGIAHDRYYTLHIVDALHDTNSSLGQVWFNLTNLAELRVYDCSRREECSLADIRHPGDRDRLMVEWTAAERTLKNYVHTP